MPTEAEADAAWNRRAPAGEGLGGKAALTWKPISTWQKPPYAGFTPKVVVGRMWRGPSGSGEMPWPLGVAWFNGSRWIDVADDKPWPEEPTIWLCEATGHDLADAPPAEGGI